MNDHSPIVSEQPANAASAQLLALPSELESLAELPGWSYSIGSYGFRVGNSGNSIWLMVRESDELRYALRVGYIPSPRIDIRETVKEGRLFKLTIDTQIGACHVQVDFPDPKKPLVHWHAALVPAENLIVNGWPADVYVLDGDGGPHGTAGTVHVSQNGPTGAALFASTTRPWHGSLLYLQNLTELNDYFELTETAPSSQLCIRWPELGFILPDSRDKPVKAGRQVTLSDAYLLLSEESPVEKVEASQLFLELLADVYLAMPRPEAKFRDWPRRVDMTVRDLTHSPVCGIEDDGHRYFLAYVGADDRPPESMVQLALLLPLMEFADWQEAPIDLIDRIRANIPKFYNEAVKSIVRWLPGDPKVDDRGEEHMGHEIMDSWYLYHTLLNLSRLAQRGDSAAKKLFLKSVDFGIRVARHFSYRWPVFYNIHSLGPIKAETKPGYGGEHDVSAQYVHVMMQAWDMTEDDRFIEEAERAAATMVGAGFELGYQLNNTAFGAGGLARLYRATGKAIYRDLGNLCIANVVQNFWLWECDFGFAKHYQTFLGAAPLRDCKYLALYEELEILAAFHEYLDVLGDETPPSVRLFVCEYCKYLIDRAWYHYPCDLPPEAISEKAQSGHINRDLAIPLEDIYDGRTQSGTVGQEVYGAAAPFVFATRHFHRISKACFVVHCEYPIADFKFSGRIIQGRRRNGKLSFRLLGDKRCKAHVRIVPNDYIPLPRFEAKLVDSGHPLKSTVTEVGCVEFEVSGDAEIQIVWRDDANHEVAPPLRKPARRKRSSTANVG